VKRTILAPWGWTAVTWVLCAGLLVWALDVVGPTEGAILVGGALYTAAVFASVFVGAGRAADARRAAAVASTHPGWTLLRASATRTQVTSMRAAGRRLRLHAPVTLGWGPQGLGLWTTRRNQPVPVLEYSWPEVLHVAETDDLRTLHGRRAPGIRIRLADGSVQDVAVTATRAIRASHPGAARAEAVARSIEDTRRALTR